MKNNSHELTLERNYLEKYRFLIKEYEQVKNKTHPLHKGAIEFYKANDTCRKRYVFTKLLWKRRNFIDLMQEKELIQRDYYL